MHERMRSASVRDISRAGAYMAAADDVHQNKQTTPVPNRSPKYLALEVQLRCTSSSTIEWESESVV